MFKFKIVFFLFGEITVKIRDFKNLLLLNFLQKQLGNAVIILKTQLFLLVFLIAFITSTFSQQKTTINGIIFDDKTKTALPFVNVFLEGTTIGTQTDLNGDFTLNKIPPGNHRLVASMVGYIAYIQNINSNTYDQSIQIFLMEDVKYLNEIKVVAGRDKAWERHYKEFEKEFLGYNFQKKEVKIRNKEVIDFKKEKGVLTAKANEPIIIENNTLGYQYIYILQDFTKGNNKIAFKGLGRYESLKTDDSNLERKWEKNRILAYNGSLTHFLASILNNNLSEQGYRAYYQVLDSLGKITNETVSFNAKESVFTTSNENYYNIILDCPLLVYYDKSNVHEFSALKQMATIYITEKGDLLDPYTIELKNDMGERRVAKTLPFDYSPPAALSNKNMLPVNLEQLPHVLRKSLSHLREKVEAIGIEQYYLAGEKLEFDVIVKDLSTLQPSNISTPLYVDFIDLEKRILINHFILKLEEGFTKMRFPIDKNFQTGNFQIRAYTNWMLNFSDEGIFKKNITVFSENFKNEIPDLQAKPIFETLLIHVEGGSLVQGLTSKILIETKDNFGGGVSQTFQLLNDKTEILLEGETDNTGMITFEHSPKPGENYIIMANNQLFNLPVALTKGSVLAVDNTSSAEKVKIFIQSNVTQSDTLTLAILKEAEVLVWKSFINSKSTVLFNIPKENLEGKVSVFLIDQDSKTIAERQIFVADSNEKLEFQKKIATDRELMAQKQSQLLEYHKQMPFNAEKGITIKGTLIKLNGKESKKKTNVVMLVSSLKTDSTKQLSQTYYTEGINHFAFENLQFFGQKQATLFTENNNVIIDTNIYIPRIYSEKLLINWKLLQNPVAIEELEKRNTEAFQDSLKVDISFEEVKIESGNMDENAIEGISPNYYYETKQIMYQKSMSVLLDDILSIRNKKFNRIAVFIDDKRLEMEEWGNINQVMKPAMVDKILIFENIIPLVFGNTDCAILIKLSHKAGRGLGHENKKTIIKGYDIGN